MNMFTFFALMSCAIFALVSAVPIIHMVPAEMAVERAEAIPGDDVLEGAESRGYGYNGRGGGGGGRWGGGKGRGGGGGRGHYVHDHYHHGYYGR